MTINRSNIDIAGNGTDIFVISQPGQKFTNFGHLTTSGAVSRAIHVTANGVTVDNRGTLTTGGDGSSAIIVGDAYGAQANNVTVLNHGSITTTGGTLWDFPDGPIFAAGIDLFGDHNTAVNYGTITNLNGDDAGMNSVGSYSTLTNRGQIDSTVIGMVLDQYTGDEAHSSAVNYGSIVTHWDGSYGMLSLATDNVLKNFGSIHVDGVMSFGMALEADRNHGENRGTIWASGEADRGVLLEGVAPTFDNYGTIQVTGAGGIGARFSGEDAPGTDGGTFTNYGTIASTAWAVKGAFANDHFINRGTLVGDAYMGAGDDTFVAGKGGSLSGTLTLADGNDLIVFEKGGGKLVVSDFVAGAGTDDVINLGAFGYQSFAEVMSHASQSGSDVLLCLGSKDQIVLQNVSLGALAADDFALGGANAAMLAANAAMFAQPGHHDLFGVG
jgi:hypothetical protein